MSSSALHHCASRTLASISPTVRIGYQVLTLVLVAFHCTADAVATTASYDSLNRLTSVVYSPTQRIDYVYDAAGNLIEERVNGSAGLTVTAQASPVAGGTVSILPAQSGYVAGDVVTVTTTPAAGYTFTGWSGVAGCSLAASCTFTLGTTNAALVANYAAPTSLQPLRMIVVPSNAGTISPTPNPAGYAPGTSLTFTVAPNAGYALDAWYGGACTSVSSTTCSFTMPSVPTDVYVNLKAPGSGFAITTVYRSFTAAGVAAYDPRLGGVIDVSPAQSRIPAGTQTTLRFRSAAGYRFDSVEIRNVSSGALDTVLCASVQYTLWPSGSEAVCTFAMPATDLEISALYAPDPRKYLVDVTPSPVDGGNMRFTPPTPQYPKIDETGSFETPAIRGRYSAMAGISITLSAQPTGGRPFLMWQNGPCAGSTNQVCTFVMPANNVLSTPLYGDEPSPQCTYSLSVPSMAVSSAAASRTITVNTQPGCNFNAFLITAAIVTTVLPKSANSVTVDIPENTDQYARDFAVRIHGGNQAFTVSIVQAGRGVVTVSAPTSVNFGSVENGSIPVSSTRVTLTNTSGATTLGGRTATVGAFAIVADTCSGDVVAGGTCTVDLQVVPTQAGAVTGELMVGSSRQVWSVPLSANVLPTRTNVAARANGGRILATDRYDLLNTNESALIEGDRRYSGPSISTIWLSTSVSTQQYLEARFASQQSVEWVYLFGLLSSPNLAQIPSTSHPDVLNTLTGFQIQAWTGTQWSAVTEISRVDGSGAWRRVRIQPVTTDRIRVVLPVIPSGQFFAAELEVWTVPSDTTPDSFSFAQVTNAPLGTSIQSASITPTGFNAPVSITVTGGTYAIGCNGAFTAAAGTLSPGQSVCVQHTTASAPGTTVQTTLVVGGVAATFSTITASAPVVVIDVTPDPIASQTINNVSRSSYVYFAPFTVTGINAPASLVTAFISNPRLEISIGCTGIYDYGVVAGFGRELGVVNNGQTICGRHTSSPNASTLAVSTLLVGTANVQLNSFTAALMCALDIDGANGVTAAVDGVIINRYLLGVRGDALVAGLTPIGARNTGALVTPILGSGTQFDVLGRAVPAPTATVDGLILIRLMLGVPDTALLNGIAIPAGVTFGNAAAIRGNVNSKCGTGY